MVVEGLKPASVYIFQVKLRVKQCKHKERTGISAV